MQFLDQCTQWLFKRKRENIWSAQRKKQREAECENLEKGNNTNNGEKLM
jgi:hypothetical protein